VKAYENSLPYDGIISIMGQAIPPECTVNLLELGKETWKFKYMDDQLANEGHQCQSDQQKQIMLNMKGKLPGKSNDGKRNKT
jgi:hypothetical protein